MAQNMKPSSLVKAVEARKTKTTRPIKLDIRLSPEEMQSLDSKAKRIGATRSEYVRAAINRSRIVDRSPETVKFRIAVIHWCGLLNQYLKILNTSGPDPAVQAKVEKLIDWLQGQKEHYKML
jgi:hypothetical protein